MRFLTSHCCLTAVLSAFLCATLTHPLSAQDTTHAAVKFGPYLYEEKPSDPAFEKFHPRLAPEPRGLLLQPDDRLAICGDSITEQKMYSRIIETYLTVCMPELRITARQYGWSGEKTDGFLRRMERDCLTFEPTVATICYGMNDARYRPFDVNNGRWYADHYAAIVDRFQAAGVRVVLGSPGAAGRIASWVNPKSGTLDEHNLNLCALRDIAIGVAEEKGVAFADVFWPMYKAQVFAARKYSTPEDKYEVAGKDGIHPGWAGQVIMAYAFLTAMGLDGDLGTIDVDWSNRTATATTGHAVEQFHDQSITIRSERYPYCATGPIDQDDSIRSGMQLVPFQSQLNRIQLVVTGLPSDRAKVTWGQHSCTVSREQLSEGINLMEWFEATPFDEAFRGVDEAVAAKQAYETEQVKRSFHSQEGKADFAATVARTEAERTPLADAIQAAFVPVTHTLTITPLPAADAP